MGSGFVGFREAPNPKIFQAPNPKILNLSPGARNRKRKTAHPEMPGTLRDLTRSVFPLFLLVCRIWKNRSHM